MRNIFATFCATSLCWSLLLLYGFACGHVERHQPDFGEAMQAQLASQAVTPARAVHLSRN